eukprot:13096727-Ditylum_brightwellii.AAC.1
MAQDEATTNTNNWLPSLEEDVGDDYEDAVGNNYPTEYTKKVKGSVKNLESYEAAIHAVKQSAQWVKQHAIHVIHIYWCHQKPTLCRKHDMEIRGNIFKEEVDVKVWVEVNLPPNYPLDVFVDIYVI